MSAEVTELFAVDELTGRHTLITDRDRAIKAMNNDPRVKNLFEQYQAGLLFHIEYAKWILQIASEYGIKE